MPKGSRGERSTRKSQMKSTMEDEGTMGQPTLVGSKRTTKRGGTKRRAASAGRTARVRTGAGRTSSRTGAKKAAKGTKRTSAKRGGSKRRTSSGTKRRSAKQ